jgi:DNA-binding NarL/FixJ family response regulator
MLVDDLDLVRLGMRAMLRAFKHIRVVAEASDGTEALQRIIELRPDVVLMDIKMLKLDGIEATRQVKALVPTTAVIMLTTSEDDALVIDAVRAGAGGYLLKDASPELLVSTIEAVRQRTMSRHP